MQLTSAGRDAFAILACAGLYAAAVPPFDHWPLAFVALVPLQLALRGRGPRIRAGIGLLTGTAAAFATILTPVAAALSAYFQVSFLAGLVSGVVVAVSFGGVGFVVLTVLAGDPERDGLVSVAKLALAVVVSEAYRSGFLTGLPWLLLGHALAPVPELAQLARFGGVDLLSACIAGVNGALFHCLMPGRRRAALALVASLAALFLLSAWGRADPGTVRPATEAPPASDALRIALVQPAVPQSWRRDPANVERVRSRLAEMSRAALPADLVVWPENALPVLMPPNAGLVSRTVEEWPADTALLFGAPRADPAAAAMQYNAAFLIAPDADVWLHRDKSHLVPFTEYAPFGLTVTGGARFTAGDSPRALPLAGERLGVLICYEMLFAHLVAATVHDGAGLLFNLSNDGYFGSSAGARQHLSAVVLAAISTGRPVLRATLDGFTVAIDEAGRVVAAVEPGEPAVVRVDVRPRHDPTPAPRVAPVLRCGAFFLCGWALLVELRCVARIAGVIRRS